MPKCRFRRHEFALFLAILVVVVALPAPATSPPLAVSDVRPRLAVVIVVDQMRADHLTRLEGEFRDGFARLLKEGVSFSEARHDHAITVTAVGHATIATGCFPAQHGIVGNSWYDRTSGRTVYACADSTVQIVGDSAAAGCSPRGLLRSTVGDWLKGASPPSRVFSISEKDCAAILLGGRHPDGVWWYDDRTGDFVTSTYYTAQYPEWVEAFNRSETKDRYYHSGWAKGWPEAAYATAHADSFPAENDGVDITFPHRFDTSKGKPDTAYYRMLTGTPFSDELLFDFARALISEEQLGADTVPDLLWISCSATDVIGHNYGPDSQEMVDNLLRLDRYLGGFLRYLDEAVGANNYVAVLTADHGVMSLPEDLVRQGVMAERIPRAGYRRVIDSVAANVAESLGIGAPLVISRTNGIVLDTGAALARGIAPEDLRQAVAARLRRISSVDEVMTYGDLFGPRAVVRGYRDMYRRSFRSDRAPDLALRLVEYTLIDDDQYGTTHGSPYDYDTHVPLVFAGLGVAHGIAITTPVRSVDIAPTLAALLGITPPNDIDGVTLKDALVPR
jgi:predicted AlkP superfamily pyrophosphatase or phosphodiesterase